MSLSSEEVFQTLTDATMLVLKDEPSPLNLKIIQELCIYFIKNEAGEATKEGR